MSKPPRPAPRRKRPEPARANRARAVAELLPDVGRAAFRRFGFVQSSIVSRWAEIVGPRYAEVSAPESLRFPHGERANGNLTLVVRGAHAAMMQHITPEIVEHHERFARLISHRVPSDDVERAFELALTPGAAEKVVVTFDA